MRRLKYVATICTTVIALSSAAPAFAGYRLSPTGYARSYGQVHAYIEQLTNGGSGVSKVQYVREASQGTLRTIWNKSGAGTTVSSGSGSTLVQHRTCEWVPDNDDKCSSYHVH
ncbi:hypothetical protein ABZ930_15080 [Streptomyces sp. NPDC046716]|uniref:hypothetical protein n=1 Tax=Streptomyces sp. NPDC046716 TaxID=3157093 RepID=UPI0033C02FA5